MTSVKRLISTFIPTNYNLSLSLEREARTFSGVVTIQGESVVPGELSVHSKELTISAAHVDGKAVEWKQLADDELQLSGEAISAGNHTVTIAFSGTITDAMHGLYPCYFEYGGAKKELLATQFESHHAREVFPCVDEPEAKATFDVTLSTEKDITVLGNQPVSAQKDEDDRLVTTFEQTPRMSTYLLAFVVGELHKKTATTKDGVEVNVWATPAQPAESLTFALDIAVRAIEFYDDYFGVPYPLPKSDHVALPDFSSGAMENWGLITYREIALLADPATTSISSRQYIATVITHELAHQWFGNLVTMKWWNNLWLNESFANFMEYVAVDALHPEWNIWLDYASQEPVMALRRDAMDGVQPVQIDVNHPDEISTLFDGAIVYAKGGRLLRMLQHYIGTDAFQAGLRAYFKAHAYQNTDETDLWNALSESSGKDIATLMNTWISQPGYPIVHVAKNDDNSITLRQEQFFIGEHKPSNHRTWPIPLFSTCGQMPELLEESTITVPRSHESLLLFNTNAAAHYIPHYNDALTRDILAAIKEGSLSEIDRLSYLNDAILLARGGVISTAELLPIVAAYKHETSEPVWGLISMTLGELRKFVAPDSDDEKRLKKVTGDIAAAQYEALGWEVKKDETEETSKLRATIIGLTLYSDNPEATARAKELFETNSLESLNPELRALIIGSVVRHDDTGETSRELLQRYKTTSSAELQQDICAGLTSTKRDDIIQLLLKSMKDSSTIRAQDVTHWFVYLIRNRSARTTAWQWLQADWPWIMDTFSGDKSYDYFPRYAASGLMTSDELEQYRAFFTPKRDIPALTRVIDLGINEIAGRVELIARDKAPVLAALRNVSDV